MIPEMEYLGHMLTSEDLERQLEKNKAIEEMERPCSKCQIHQFLGLCGWHGNFVPHFKAKAAPLLNNKYPFN